MSLYTINSNNAAIASDVDQLINIFNALHDIGVITFASQAPAPNSGSFSLATATGTNLGIGAYSYEFTYVTGQYKSDGSSLVQTGETTVSGTLSVTTTSGNQAVTVTLPVSMPQSSIVAINIYRTSVGGADYKLIATVKAGTASYTDSVADGSRGTQTPPANNTTGTIINNLNTNGTIQAVGTAANIDINFIPKGTGMVKVNGNPIGANFLTSPYGRLHR